MATSETRVQFGGLVVPENPLNPPNRHHYMDDVNRLLTVVKGHYDSAWCIDHLAGDVLEGWTALTYLAACHPELVWGHTVLCQSFRNPALDAKMAATLQFLSGGRFVLGIGAGGQAAEHLAYGYPFPSGNTRVAELDEALQIITTMWTEERASLEGMFYRIQDASCEPKPDPRPPIMIGAFRPKMLRLTARHAERTCGAWAAKQARRIPGPSRWLDRWSVTPSGWPRLASLSAGRPTRWSHRCGSRSPADRSGSPDRRGRCWPRRAQ